MRYTTRACTTCTSPTTCWRQCPRPRVRPRALTTLSLSHNHLSIVTQNDLGGLKPLRRLDLSHNLLGGPASPGGPRSVTQRVGRPVSRGLQYQDGAAAAAAGLQQPSTRCPVSCTTTFHTTASPGSTTPSYPPAGAPRPPRQRTAGAEGLFQPQDLPTAADAGRGPQAAENSQQCLSDGQNGAPVPQQQPRHMQRWPPGPSSTSTTSLKLTEHITSLSHCTSAPPPFCTCLCRRLASSPSCT